MIYEVLFLIVVFFVIPLALFSWYILLQMREMKNTVKALSASLKSLHEITDKANREFSVILEGLKNR